jgi:hypothetical protein
MALYQRSMTYLFAPKKLDNKEPSISTFTFTPPFLAFLYESKSVSPIRRLKPSPEQ